MKGNDALAEAAVRAGCRFFGGYPITPQSEILEYLSWRLPEVDGTFVQAESELSGVNMVYGAAAAGFRAMTSSSGPGYSLLQEGISYIASAELPAVFVNVQRYGSGLGDIFRPRATTGRQPVGAVMAITACSSLPRPQLKKAWT